jgi:hypothetical protein
LSGSIGVYLPRVSVNPPLNNCPPVSFYPSPPEFPREYIILTTPTGISRVKYNSHPLEFPVPVSFYPLPPEFPCKYLLILTPTHWNSRVILTPTHWNSRVVMTPTHWNSRVKYKRHPLDFQGPQQGVYG